MHFKSVTYIAMFVLLMLLFTIFCSIDGNFRFQIGLKGKQANLDRFDGSCGRNDMKYSMIMDSIQFDGTNVLFNYTIVVDQNRSDTVLKYKFIVKRCLSQENPDSCENFYVYNIKNYCELLQSNNPLWTTFFNCVQPQMRCPIEKGFYRGINCKLGVGAFLFFPVTGYYWKVKIQMNSENGQLLLCVLAEAQISVTRS